MRIVDSLLPRPPACQKDLFDKLRRAAPSSIVFIPQFCRSSGRKTPGRLRAHRRCPYPRWSAHRHPNRRRCPPRRDFACINAAFSQKIPSHLPRRKKAERRTPVKSHSKGIPTQKARRAIFARRATACQKAKERGKALSRFNRPRRRVRRGRGDFCAGKSHFPEQKSFPCSFRARKSAGF